MRKYALNPCSECGTEDYDFDANGLTVVWTCIACGAFVAELVEGPTP